MPHAPDLSGRALNDRYELHAVIGEGAFGRVYRGRDRRLDRPVAVKVIKPWWSEDPDWVRSFEREAQLLARVDDPGIVQIFDVGQAPEGLYYVAELVDGESLASRLERGPLPRAEACDIAEQLCVALAQAHARHVVHRDVKPANVLLSARGRVKVGDFGVALLAEGTTDGAAATIVGTPRYMAPEQAQGRPTTPATDVYSVGVVLYEMLAGRPPFSGTAPVELALSHLRDSPPPLGAEVPPALVRIAERALAKDPDDRYVDAREMATALALVRMPEPSTVEVAARRGVGAVTTAPTEAITARTVALQERPERPARPAPVAPAGPAEEAETFAVVDRRDRGAPPPTRVAPRRGPRRNVDPPARRRAAALLACVGALLLGMVAAAIVLGQRSEVRVPALNGLTRAKAAGEISSVGLRSLFGSRFSRAPKGTVIAQSPRYGVEVGKGTAVRIAVSAGPPPVEVPQLDGQSSAAAQAVLGSLGLHVGVTTVPAPGVTPGTVTSQSPAAGATMLPGSTVALSVAEVPRWRPLTTFTSDGSGRSVPFRIRGTRWRLVYSMSYQDMCTLIFFCSGPSANVAGGGGNAGGFDLSQGNGQTQTFNSGAGTYQVTVSPGSDDAQWSMTVEDYY